MAKVKLKRHSKWALIVIITLLGLYILYLTRFFILPAITAAMFAYLCYPLFNKLKCKCSKDSISAMLLILVLTIVIIVPFVWFIFTLAKEVLLLSNSLSFSEILQSVESLKLYVVNDLNLNISSSQFDSFLSNFVQSLESGIRTSAIWVINGITSLMFQILFVMIFMYYFLLHGKKAYQHFEALLPLSHKSKLFLKNQISADIKALFLGQGLIALIQGVLGAIGYLIVGLPNFLLAGFGMIILAMFPWVGPFFILIPAGIYLLIKGNLIAGIFLLVWSLVVSNIDNVLRPYIVRSFTQIHFLVVLIGVIVGIQAFNLIGIILGPLLLSILVALVQIYYLENKM
jgi:predicted PurR-regulated permease PerM